jgi:hypothetical protein
MREKQTYLRVCAALVFCVLLLASLTQAVVKVSGIDAKTMLDDGGERGTQSTHTWEDPFNNQTKIDTSPPGAGQSDNYVVSSGQVSMANTYTVWTDPAWTKMKPITITSTASQTLYNYVIYFSIPYTTGMQSQYQDIRFKHQNNPSNWLSYWIERFNATTAHVWVLVPSIPIGTSMMYLFYGNPSAQSQSNFTAVFTWSAHWSSDNKTSVHTNDNQGSWDPDLCFGNNEFLLSWEEGQPRYIPWSFGYKQGIKGAIYDINGN